MFRSTVTAPAPPADVVDTSDLIPLSVLELDLPAPATGWLIELDRRGIAVVADDIGRDSLTKDDARELITEHRENEARKARHREETERRAIEADQQWRAQLSPGIPWYEIPAGVTAAEMWAQAEHDARPKRRSLLEDALANTGSMEYHPLRDEEP
jgi:hypothetical protein